MLGNMLIEVMTRHSGGYMLKLRQRDTRHDAACPTTFTELVQLRSALQRAAPGAMPT